MILAMCALCADGIANKNLVSCLSAPTAVQRWTNK